MIPFYKLLFIPAFVSCFRWLHPSYIWTSETFQRPVLISVQNVPRPILFARPPFRRYDPYPLLPINFQKVSKPPLNEESEIEREGVPMVPSHMISNKIISERYREIGARPDLSSNQPLHFTTFGSNDQRLSTVNQEKLSNAPITETIKPIAQQSEDKSFFQRNTLSLSIVAFIFLFSIIAGLLIIRFKRIQSNSAEANTNTNTNANTNS